LVASLLQPTRFDNVFGGVARIAAHGIDGRLQSIGNGVTSLGPMRALPRFLGAVALVAVTLGGGDAGADEPKPPERDTSPAVFPDGPTQPNLLLIGGVVTVVWYGAALGTSYLWSDSPSASALRIPVAGPYMALAKTGCGSQEVGCGTLTVVIRTLFTSLSAVGQVGGLLAMAEGALLPTAAAERDVSSVFRLAGESGEAEVRLEPAQVGASDLGLSLTGAF
jgi:hypothetical protein